MQGLACKVTIVTVVLFSVTSLSSPIWAADLINKNMPNINSGAGCMGCHQGETITMPNNEIADKKAIISVKKIKSKNHRKKEESTKS